MEKSQAKYGQNMVFLHTSNGMELIGFRHDPAQRLREALYASLEHGTAGLPSSLH
jgi:hypothetical protein